MRFTTHSSLVLPLVALLSLTASAWPHAIARHEKPPVCVIGAGPAGLTAASRLEKKGIKAVVFDKQAEVGGKCQAYYDKEGIFHPLGAAFFSNATYPETLKVLKETDVSIEEFALAGARQMFRYNYSDGAIEPVAANAPIFLAQVAAEIPRYFAIWTTVFKPFGVTNYKKGVPDDLAISGAEWFRKNNFTALPILLVNPLALYGYGDINIVPALYILQYFTPDILTGFIGQHAVYYTDFHKIFVEWTKKALCKTPIHTSSEVRSIDRSGKNPVIRYTQPHGSFYKWSKQECSKLIFAFPPNIDNLERAGLDLTEAEYKVFSNVTTHNYYSSAVEFKLPFGVSYIANSSALNVAPPNDGEPVALLRLNEQSNVSVAWQWGPYDLQSEKAGRRILKESLSKINKDPRNKTEVPEPVTDSNVRAFKKWDYFPHFGTDALKCGAYESFNKIQGKNKSYWASGLGGMEIVEWAIRAGQDVVDNHF